MNKQIKKLIPYFFILIIMVGLLSPVVQVIAQGAAAPITAPSMTLGATPAPAVQPVVNPPATGTPVANKPTLEGGISNNLNSCRLIPIPHLNGCYEQIIEWIFYEIPSFLLGIAGNFFNVIVSLTLSSALYGSPFIGDAWTVVRDLSNIFFILVLLYVAIQTILGLSHETKTIIRNVIVMALLINFSMFFTKIVIDTSNILALVFYNKITVTTDYIPVVSLKKTGVQEKDISGAMMSYFDPTKVLGKDFFDKFRQKTYQTSKKGALASAGAGALIGSAIPIIGTGLGAVVGTVGYYISSSSNDIPTGIVVGFILIAGLIIAFAAYAFFIAGLSFLSRMIELWILIIFSPFAFMSSVIPKLSGISSIGWDEWLKRLLKLSFMAPIFMFFLYLIFMIIQSNIFINLVDRTDAQQGWVETIILMIIPALTILILLNKATKFAKEAAGELGERVIGGAKLIAGLAVGGAALGGALAGRATLGAVTKSVVNNTARDKAYTFKDTRDKWNLGGFKNRASAISSGIKNASTQFIPAAIATAIHGGRNLNAVGQAQPGGVGKYLRDQEEKSGHEAHATHILDAKMKSEFGHQPGYEDKKYKDLTEHEQETVKGEVEKDEMAKFVYGKQFKDLEAPQTQIIQNGYNAGERAIDNGHGKTVGIGTTPGNARDLNGNPVITGTQTKSDYFVEASKANAVVGEFVQALRKGTYDVRNLPDLKMSSKGIVPGFGVGTIALIAAGVRMGLKKGGGVEYGTAQGDALKDISNTISEALKNVKINVSSGGGDHGGDGHTKEVKSVGH